MARTRTSVLATFATFATFATSATLMTSAVLGGTMVGCVVHDPAAETANLDPTLPGVDAGPNGTPAMGGSAGNGGSDAGVAGDARVTDPSSAFPRAKEGEIVVTEVMYDPSGPQPKAEWFEVLDTASSPRSLAGFAIVDGSGRTHTIAAGTVVMPGVYSVFVRDKATALFERVPSGAIVYEYGGGSSDMAGVILLNSTSGYVGIFDGPTPIVEVPYGRWFLPANGHSVQLASHDYTAVGSAPAWCLSAASWTAGSDRGTPGAPSDCR